MHVHLDKAYQTRETVSKEGSGTDEEPIDTRVSKVRTSWKDLHWQYQTNPGYFTLLRTGPDEEKKPEAQ